MMEMKCLNACENLSVEDWLQEIDDDLDYHLKRVDLLNARKQALKAFYNIKEDNNEKI